MMFFHFTKNIQHLLFEEWSIRTDAGENEIFLPVWTQPLFAGAIDA